MTPIKRMTRIKKELYKTFVLFASFVFTPHLLFNYVKINLKNLVMSPFTLSKGAGFIRG